MNNSRSIQEGNQYYPIEDYQQYSNSNQQAYQPQYGRQGYHMAINNHNQGSQMAIHNHNQGSQMAIHNHNQGYQMAINNNNQVSNLASNQNNNSVSRARSDASRLVSSQVRNQEVVKGGSRISYVPYQKKVMEYQNKTTVERVPIKRKVIEYEERRVMETIPREVIKQDYYAVQKRVEYIKEIIPERKIQMVPVQRKVKRYEYVPVEKQIVHYPENIDLQTAKGQSRVVLQQQGVFVKPDAEFRPINPTLIYNYSNQAETKDNPIGYVDQGHYRPFSNAPTMSNHPYYNEIYNSNYPTNFSHSRVQSSNHIESHQPLSPRLYNVTSLEQGSRWPETKQHTEGQSYIKQLNNINGLQGSRNLKQPFKMMQNQYKTEGITSPQAEYRLNNQHYQYQDQRQRQYEHY